MADPNRPAPLTDTRSDPESIGENVENFYNPQRRHSYLGYVSPIDFELHDKSPRLRHGDTVDGIRGSSTLSGERSVL